MRGKISFIKKTLKFFIRFGSDKFKVMIMLQCDFINHLPMRKCPINHTTLVGSMHSKLSAVDFITSKI